MKKDSKDSLAQKRWEFALKMHEDVSISLERGIYSQSISATPEMWQPQPEKKNTNTNTLH